jgi:hypothetical protein
MKDARRSLRHIEWNCKSTTVDVHELGVHYFSSKYLPATLDPSIYKRYIEEGLTPPNALPIEIYKDTQQKIKSFLDEKYYSLEHGGVQYLGNEFNIQTEEDWYKKKIKVCFIRTIPYYVADGSFGHFVVQNFIEDFDSDVFIDFSYAPEKKDISKLIRNDIPLWFGSITKRPLTDFDIIFIASSYPPERINIPFLMVKSGIPLYLWERCNRNLPYYNNTPIVCGAGIGNTCVENLIGDNPIHGIAGNSVYDYVIIGEGELTALKFIQEYRKNIELNKDKREFRKKISNEKHKGIYDPTKILFEYAKKEHIDTNGNKEVFEKGGHVKRVSLIDEDTKTKYVLAGKESEEYQDLIKMYNLEN